MFLFGNPRVWGTKEGMNTAFIIAAIILIKSIYDYYKKKN
jgi:hypothetical protein